MDQLTLGVLTFNDGAYLQELLNSIENQSDKNFKLLIINNSSTDFSQSIIDEFIKLTHEYDVRTLNNPKNYGSFLGTKQLISSATTSHLSIIHGDDLLRSNYVEVAKSYITLNPDFCAFNFDLEEIGDRGNILTGKILKSSWTNFQIINRLLVSGLNPGVMPGAIINIKKLGNNSLNDDFKNVVLNGTEDIFLWQQIVRSSGKVMRVPSMTYCYRRHAGQVSKNLDIYGQSLGYARKVNFLTAKTRFEKLLCVSEIQHEYSSVNFHQSYLIGLNNLVNYRRFSKFRFLNIIIRRTANVINYLTKFDNDLMS